MDPRADVPTDRDHRGRAAAVNRGCLSCWRWAAQMTRIYTLRSGEPITTVGLYRERHAEHQARIAQGLDWWPDP